MQLQYGGSWASPHPGNNETTGTLTTITLASGEMLTGVNYGSGAVIDRLEFVTNIQTYGRAVGNGDIPGYVSGVEIKFFKGNIFDGHVTNAMLRAIYIYIYI